MPSSFLYRSDIYEYWQYIKYVSVIATLTTLIGIFQAHNGESQESGQRCTLANIEMPIFIRDILHDQLLAER